MNKNEENKSEVKSVKINYTHIKSIKKNNNINFNNENISHNHNNVSNEKALYNGKEDNGPKERNIKNGIKNSKSKNI
jgi:hypothetical protein